jgi:hypothetical protein
MKEGIMHAFGITALLGLGLLAVTKIAGRYVFLAAEVWTVVLGALGVGAT